MVFPVIKTERAECEIAPTDLTHETEQAIQSRYESLHFELKNLICIASQCALKVNLPIAGVVLVVNLRIRNCEPYLMEGDDYENNLTTLTEWFQEEFDSDRQISLGSYYNGTVIRFTNIRTIVYNPTILMPTDLSDMLHEEIAKYN